MKFIPRDHKIARLWVESCTASLSIEKQEAAAMFANLCGFRTWESVVQVIGNQIPTIVDEDCNPDIVSERKNFYREILVSVFAMNPTYADYLVENLSPSSGKTPKKFSFDHDSMHDDLKEGVMSLIPPGMDFRALQEGMQDFIEMLAETVPSLAGMDTRNFVDRMRISSPIDPADYYNFCSSMGWEIIEDTYAEDYEHCKHLFCMNASFGDVYVYANSLSKIPMDNDDEMAEHLKAQVLEDAKESTDFPAIILFAGKFMARDYRGKSFTCGGCLYKDGEWYDFLLNQGMDTVDKLFEAAEADIDLNNPSLEFEDKNNYALVSFLAYTNEKGTYQEVFEHQIMTVGSPSGWGTVLLGDKK